MLFHLPNHEIMNLSNIKRRKYTVWQHWILLNPKQREIWNNFKTKKNKQKNKKKCTCKVCMQANRESSSSASRYFFSSVSINLATLDSLATRTKWPSATAYVFFSATLRSPSPFTKTAINLPVKKNQQIFNNVIKKK